MTSYYKFNNSRSQKNPFFVYIKIDNGKVTDTFGSSWTEVPKGSIEITESEFNRVLESSNLSALFRVGDVVIQTEYVSTMKRISKVVTIYTHDKGGPNHHDRAILKNRENVMVSRLRKEDVLIYKQ